MDPWSKGVLVVMALIAVWTCLSVLIERDERREANDNDLDPRDAESAGSVSPFPRSTAVPTDRASRRADLAVRTHRAQSRVHAVRVDEQGVGDRAKDQMKTSTRVGEPRRTGALATTATTRQPLASADAGEGRR
jgi:hypothetical protein